MIHGSVGGARKRGVGCGSAFKKPEALWTGSTMALKEAEPEAFRKLVAPPSLFRRQPYFTRAKKTLILRTSLCQKLLQPLWRIEIQVSCDSSVCWSESTVQQNFTPHSWNPFSPLTFSLFLYVKVEATFLFIGYNRFWWWIKVTGTFKSVRVKFYCLNLFTFVGVSDSLERSQSSGEMIVRKPGGGNNRRVSIVEPRKKEQSK